MKGRAKERKEVKQGRKKHNRTKKISLKLNYGKQELKQGKKD